MDPTAPNVVIVCSLALFRGQKLSFPSSVDASTREHIDDILVRLNFTTGSTGSPWPDTVDSAQLTIELLGKVEIEAEWAKYLRINRERFVASARDTSTAKGMPRTIPLRARRRPYRLTGRASC